ncbi:MAG: hypothetical protein ACYC7D_05390 [Nitrososphaerales archaeon]
MSQDSPSPSRELSAVFVQNVIERRLSSPAAATSPYFFLKREVPIVASYCVYRDAEYLRSSLDSVSMYVDAIMVLDGRFLDFNPLPDDGTARIVSESASRFDPRYFREEYRLTQKFVYLDVESVLGPTLEVEKRDYTFQYIPRGSYAFIIDGDEICVGDVKAGLEFVRANADKKIFWIYVEEEGNPGWKPRLIKVEDGMHYGANHWTILGRKNELVTDSVYADNPEQEKLTQFKILNLGSKRTGERGVERIAYREIMRKKDWKEGDAV